MVNKCIKRYQNYLVFNINCIYNVYLKCIFNDTDDLLLLFTWQCVSSLPQLLTPGPVLQKPSGKIFYLSGQNFINKG